jgi:hypothetical protein
MDDTQKKMTERFDTALKQLDKMFQHIPLASPFMVDAIIHDFQPEAYDYSEQINALLLDKFKYADEYNGRYWITLNEKGMAAKNAGGHFVYEAMQKEIKQLTTKKLTYDANNAKRIYQTYWLTFALAMASFVISIILLILKLRESGARAH